MSLFIDCPHCGAKPDFTVLVRVSNRDDSPIVDLCGNCAEQASQAGGYRALEFQEALKQKQSQR